MAQETQKQGFSAETGEQTGGQATKVLEGESLLERHTLSLADVVLQVDQHGDSVEGIVVLPLPANLSLARGGMRFLREGDNLVIESGMASGVVVVEGYFTATPPPVLTTARGGAFSPSFVASFLEQSGSQKYAMGWLGGKVDDGEIPVIGEVVSLQGEVQVVRDGLMMTLEAGDKILEGDIISTGQKAEAFMRFTDKMEFRLGEDARLAIDEYLYDEVSSSGLQILSIIAGAFSYASGLIAGSDPSSVKLQTPYGLIGIRGTTILGDVRDEELVVTVLEGRVALLRDGLEVAVLDEHFETLSLSLERGVQKVDVAIASEERVLGEYDLLDNSAQQLGALESGEVLEDEISADTDAEAALSDGEQAGLLASAEVYIGSVLEEEETSFLPTAERGRASTAFEGSAEEANLPQVFRVAEDDAIVEGSARSTERTVVAEELRVLSAGELSFEGSSVGVRFDFSSTGTSSFAEAAGIVYRHGGEVLVVRQEQVGLDDRYEFVVSGVADVTGSDGRDYLTGDGAANRLVGGAGADTLFGDGGDDRLYGGLGNDELYGNAGQDRLYGGLGKDTFNGGGGDDTIYGELGDDIIRGGADSDTLYGGLGADSIYGELGDDIIRGGADGDTRLDGGEGADTIYGGGGNDKIYGGEGADTLLHGGLGSDSIYGEGGNDNLYGGAGDDTLEGGVGTDAYVFGAGDGTDRVDDNGGAIVFDQGTGNSYAGAKYTFTRPDISGEAVTLTVTKDGNTLNVIKFASDPSAGYTFATRSSGIPDTSIAPSELVVPPIQDGSQSNPFLASEGVDILTGSLGADWVSYAGSASSVGIDLRTDPATVRGGWAVDDELSGFNNVIGSDADSGGVADFLFGNDNPNNLYGGAGHDHLYGLAGSDAIYGGAGIDAIYGGADNDALYGESGNDYLYGGLGADTLDGGDDADTASYALVSNSVRVSLLLQGGGKKQVDFDGTHGFTANNNEAVGDILSNIENLDGSGHDDWLVGDGNENVLYGGDGNDRLEGGAGDDTLSGGEGTDTLVGGADADTYVFEAGDGTDTVIDDGGTIAFFQGPDGNDYTGAAYAFSRSDGGYSRAVTLTVTKDGNTLNIIEFTTYPASGYTFATRSSSSGVPDTLITNFPAVPARTAGDGSVSKPFLAKAGVDTFAGSDSNNWASYEDSTYPGVDVYLETPGNNEGWADRDTFSGINNLIGSDHYDLLVGNSGDNILRGGAGNDRLEGGAGADTLDGEGGGDSAVHDNAGKGVRVDLSLAGAQHDFETNTFGFVANNNDAVGDILISIESIYGSDHNDWLTGGDKDDYLRGMDGDDRLEGGAGADTLIGGAGADTLIGSAGVDTLSGVTGNDDLYGGLGADTLKGGGGNDNLYGDAGNDKLDGGSGKDRLDGGAGTDTYWFHVGGGTDTIHDVAGDTMTLKFEGKNPEAEAADFLESSNNFNRDGNNLVITLDRNSGDSITDKITIVDAYDTDISTGIGNAAFTINIEYGFNSVNKVADADAFWHGLD